MEVEELDSRRIFARKQVAVGFVALDKYLPLLIEVRMELAAFLAKDARVRLNLGKVGRFSWRL